MPLRKLQREPVRFGDGWAIMGSMTNDITIAPALARLLVLLPPENDRGAPPPELRREDHPHLRSVSPHSRASIGDRPTPPEPRRLVPLSPSLLDMLPAILSQEEVRAILDAVERQRDRVLITVAYACGLHVSEVATLKVMRLDADEWLRRFLGHVPARGSVRLRSYGFPANAAKR